MNRTEDSYRFEGRPLFSRHWPGETAPNRLITTAAVVVGAAALFLGVKVATFSPVIEAREPQRLAVDCDGLKLDIHGQPIRVTIGEGTTILSLVEAAGIDKQDIGEGKESLTDTPVVRKVEDAYVKVNPGLSEAAAGGQSYLETALTRKDSTFYAPDCGVNVVPGS